MEGPASLPGLFSVCFKRLPWRKRDPMQSESPWAPRLRRRASHIRPWARPGGYARLSIEGRATIDMTQRSAANLPHSDMQRRTSQFMQPAPRPTWGNGLVPRLSRLHCPVLAVFTLDPGKSGSRSGLASPGPSWALYSLLLEAYREEQLECLRMSTGLPLH